MQGIVFSMISQSRIDSFFSFLEFHFYFSIIPKMNLTFHIFEVAIFPKFSHVMMELALLRKGGEEDSEGER